MRGTTTVRTDRGIILDTPVERLKGSLPTGVRAAGKRVIRRYGMATSGMRPLPDHLIIGAKRGGTSSAYTYLQQHPRVAPAFPSVQRFKGTYYFDKAYEQGEDWYRSHFPTRTARRVRAIGAGGPVVVGEACPYHLVHPLAPVRVGAVMPGCRLLVLLRDPVARAWSHYKANVRAGIEPLPFDEAIAAEPERLAGEAERLASGEVMVSLAHERYGYVDQSSYLPALRRWLRVFPREQLWIGVSEDMYADPQSAVDAMVGFLGLPPHPLTDTRQYNPSPPKEMSTATRDRLRERLHDHDGALAELVGRPLPWST